MVYRDERVRGKKGGDDGSRVGGKQGVKKKIKYKKKSKLGRVFKSTTVRETQQREKGVGGKTLQREREETDVEE